MLQNMAMVLRRRFVVFQNTEVAGGFKYGLKVEQLAHGVLAHGHPLGEVWIAGQGFRQTIRLVNLRQQARHDAIHVVTRRKCQHPAHIIGLGFLFESFVHQTDSFGSVQFRVAVREIAAPVVFFKIMGQLVGQQRRHGRQRIGAEWRHPGPLPHADADFFRIHPGDEPRAVVHRQFRRLLPGIATGLQQVFVHLADNLEFVSRGMFQACVALRIEYKSIRSGPPARTSRPERSSNMRL